MIGEARLALRIISYASTKGGAGKTTACLLLAGELVHAGARVRIIDADPRHPLVAWAELPNRPEAISVIESKGQRKIHDEIDQSRSQADFVLIDLEGIASELLLLAAGESDLVLVPSQEQFQDAQAAIDTIGAIRRAGRVARREIPSAVVLTRTRVVAKSRNARFVADQLRGSGVQVLGTEINERDAYAALYSLGGTVRSLREGDAPNLGRAITNAEAHAEEVVETLRRAGEGVHV